MEPFLGLIKLFPYDFVPKGWMRCDGTLLSIAQNQALYALVGNSYGGNPSTTFAVPDLRGAEPQTGTVYCIATVGLFPPRP